MSHNPRQRKPMSKPKHLIYLYCGTILGLTTNAPFMFNDSRWWATGNGLLAASIPIIIASGLTSIIRSKCENKLNWESKENIPLTELMKARDKEAGYTIFSLAVHITYINLLLLGFFFGAVLSAHS